MCAVEAASLLAGEGFSDRPSCVCPVVASFVRALNDRLHHADRQRLRPYVGRLVGSRGDRRLRRERRELLLAWARGGPAESRPGPVARLWRRTRIGILCGFAASVRFDEGAGEYAARVAVVRGDLDAALALLDEALGLGGSERSAASPAASVTVQSSGPAPEQTLERSAPIERDQIPQGRWPHPQRRSRPSHGRPIDTSHPRRREPDESPERRTPNHPAQQ